MIDGTYNAISGSGRIVEDPRHIVRLAGSEEYLGGDLRGAGCRDIAEYLLHRTKGVTLGEMTDYLDKNGHPDLVAKGEFGEDGEQDTLRFTWSTDEEKYQRVGD